MARYDISALMSMRSNARIDVNRFSEVGSKLLRQHSTSVLSEQPINRSRNVSSFSRQSERTNAPPEPSLRSAARQPSDPPGGHRAQKDSGFARFLKEHTSPKHQRVTAGGRIVPMEAPPKMKLPSFDQQQNVGDGTRGFAASIAENQNNAEHGTVPPKDTSFGSEAFKQDSQSAGLPVSYAFPPYGSFDPYLQNLGQTPNLLSAAGYAGLCSSLGVPWPHDNQQLDSELQPPEYHIPAAPEYPMLNYANPCVWHPSLYDALDTSSSLPTFLPPPQPHPAISTPSGFSTGSIASSGGATPLLSPFYPGYGMSLTPSGLQWHQLIHGQAPMQAPQVVPAVIQTPLYQKSLDDATKEHDNLSAQLSRLDRYMAMHTWDLDPQTKKLLVEQRVGLVKELDTVRIYREHLEWASAKIRMNALSSHAGMSDSTSSTGLYLTGNIANNQALFGQALCTSNSDSAAPTFVTPALAAAFPPRLSSNETGSSTPMPSMPWHSSTDYPGSFHSLMLQEANASCKPPTQSQRLKPKRPIAIKVPPINPKNEITSDKETRGAKPNETEWRPCTKELSSEVYQVYCHLEKIARQGASIDALLQDLELAAEQPTKPIPDGYYRPTFPATDATAKQRPTAQATEGIEAVKSKSAEYPGPEYTRQRSKDPRKSRHRPRSHEDVNKSPIVAEEDDAHSILSYVSTTDSWATVHERSYNSHMRDFGCQTSLLKRGLAHERSASPVKRPATPLFEIPNSVTQLTLISGNGDIGSSRTAHRRSGPALADDPVQTGQRSNVESVKCSYSPLLAPCLIKDRGLAGPKTMALAVPQNVHVHGIVPHIDRVGEGSRKCRTAPMAGHDSGSEWQARQLHDIKQKGSLWYKPDRGIGT
ncbi:uncharacterized protein BP01DRAFT_392448 [Aspergillus saccharolyticus JOP 1030-1]|uniref:Uncharacterized protein n=1 Tax=Aspergillus saccharolyticus JOP 1030-1 TaxID=1450539 RepID=A0A318ZB34_9EURO|nr:hypothetical protein BP01DRAFT_392448 [Aspergillus saccharolyticus JOP 1030-1]PYH44509.1 hypothetical protein BP01DRAFT_392448 [Aspergillus saccharolyticus JOP 1030-1]